MFKVNDHVVFGATGVCRVVDRVMRSFSGNPEREYFVLSPLQENNEMIYVPVDHSKPHFRRALSREQILRLLQEMPEADPQWMEEDTQRRNFFNEAIRSGDQAELIKMVKSIYFRREELAKQGKNLSATDREAMKKAERLLYNEFALGLDLEPEQVLPIILGEVPA